VIATAQSLGVRTRLQPYATTALGASEVSLLELATAYRTIASGILADPYIIRDVVRDSGEMFARILCKPLAGIDHSEFLLVLSQSTAMPPRPEEPGEADTAKKGGRKGRR